MKTPSRWSRYLATLLLAAGSCPVGAPRAEGGEIFGKVFRGMSRVVDGHHARGPATEADCCVEQLAGEIDWLEKYVDRYGSIVAKHPDVWGQSRLTRHRSEYEEKLKDELGRFKELNNASLRRSDQAFLGMALAIQSAAGGEKASAGTTTTSEKSPLAAVTNLISTGTNADQAIPFDRKAPFAATEKDFAKFGLDETNAIGLEPTIHLDHLDGYIKHLQELRRINEGDDNSDSPGYALNLVRIPVSILPGQYTQAGHGAEITVTADLQLGDDILPTTFRNLVINDLIDTIAPSMTFAANDPEARSAAWSEINSKALRQQAAAEASSADRLLQDATSTLGRLEAEADRNGAICDSTRADLIDRVRDMVGKLNPEVIATLDRATGRGARFDAVREAIDGNLDTVLRVSESIVDRALRTDASENAERTLLFQPNEPNAAAANEDTSLQSLVAKVAAFQGPLIQTWQMAYTQQERSRKEADDERKKLENARLAVANARSVVARATGRVAMLRSKLASTTSVPVPSTKSRRSRLPIPPSQFVDVGGLRQVAYLIVRAYEALGTHPANRPCIDYNDVRGLLGEELQAAYDLLSQPQFQPVWSGLPARNIPDLIRTRQNERLELVRRDVFRQLDLLAGESCPPSLEFPVGEMPDGVCEDDACCNSTDARRLCQTVTGVLAWMILVESALLDDRLVEDMRSAASLQGRISPPGGAWSGPHFGPNPSPEARRAFNDYVRLRWPIRVFALDPVAQEQNIEDMYSKQREMQIALAVAAGSGRLGSQGAMRYARRLETDMATIALNKTAVAFSHGSDTFGWRFYPRFQTPPTRNNIAAFADTLVGSNSQKRDLADRRLEPGIRECTAIIVMPSFVPFVTFDVRTNWFSLNHPQSTDQNMRQTLELSRSIKAMQNSAARCSQCASLYRDGEVARLMRRVEQLDRELPLQSMLTQIPYENTSGGFELFNTGVTDLAPELVGWYGAPGIDTTGPTTLFLIGKGFSVLDTKIVAGGQLATQVELISRQVVKVVIPPGAKPILKPSPSNCRCPQPDGFPCPPDVPTPKPDAVGARPGAVRHWMAEAREHDASSTRRVTASRVIQTANTEAIASRASAPTARRADPPATAGTRVARRQSLGFPAPEAVAVPAPIPAPTGPCASSLLELPSVLAGQTENVPVRELDPGCGVDCSRQDYIDIHLATPYGVSGHLLVPVVPPEKKQEPEATSCTLHLGSESHVLLTASRNKNGTWRVDEYYDATPDAITIEAPKWFSPPQDGEVRWSLRDLNSQGKTLIANFSTPAPHFEAAGHSFVIDGGELRNFIGDTGRPATDKTLRGAIRPYLNYLAGSFKEPEMVGRHLELTAELVSGRQTIPVAGSILVDLQYADQPEDTSGS